MISACKGGSELGYFIWKTVVIGGDLWKSFEDLKNNSIHRVGLYGFILIKYAYVYKVNLMPVGLQHRRCVDDHHRVNHQPLCTAGVYLGLGSAAHLSI